MVSSRIIFNNNKSNYGPGIAGKLCLHIVCQIRAVVLHYSCIAFQYFRQFGLEVAVIFQTSRRVVNCVRGAIVQERGPRILKQQTVLVIRKLTPLPVCELEEKTAVVRGLAHPIIFLVHLILDPRVVRLVLIGNEVRGKHVCAGPVVFASEAEFVIVSHFVLAWL
jgi:hypothetical protein